jgi:hypothetical protein
MSNQKLLQEAHDILDRSIRGDTQTGIFYNLQAIGYALVAIGNILDERRAPANGHQAMSYATKQVAALQQQVAGLVAERDALLKERQP